MRLIISSIWRICLTVYQSFWNRKILEPPNTDSRLSRTIPVQSNWLSNIVLRERLYVLITWIMDGIVLLEDLHYGGLLSACFNGIRKKDHPIVCMDRRYTHRRPYNFIYQARGTGRWGDFRAVCQLTITNSQSPVEVRVIRTQRRSSCKWSVQ